MVEKKESPRIGTDTRTISNGWIVTNGDEEIATITMSVTTLHGFRADHAEELLKNIANSSHSFYLETGNALKAEP